MANGEDGSDTGKRPAMAAICNTTKRRTILGLTYEPTCYNNTVVALVFILHKYRVCTSVVQPYDCKRSTTTLHSYTYDTTSESKCGHRFVLALADSRPFLSQGVHVMNLLWRRFKLFLPIWGSPRKLTKEVNKRCCEDSSETSKLIYCDYTCVVGERALAPLSPCHSAYSRGKNNPPPARVMEEIIPCKAGSFS